MPTASDLISKALRKVGVLSTGQTADSNDALEALSTLNDILEQWNLEDLMLLTSNAGVYALTANVNSYTIGATGAFVDIAPIEVLSAYLRIPGNLDVPLDVISYGDYLRVVQKTTTGTYPSVVSLQNTIPNGTLYLWPTPSAGLSLVLEANVQITQLADLSTTLVLSNGYQKAMVDCLAYELCIEYGRTDMIEEIKDSARISKMNVKRKNAPKDTMSFDSALLSANSGRRYTYNIFTDN